MLSLVVYLRAKGLSTKGHVLSLFSKDESMFAKDCISFAVHDLFFGFFTAFRLDAILISQNSSLLLLAPVPLEDFLGANWGIYPSDVNSRQIFEGFPV